METALIERFSLKNITILIFKYDNLHISKISLKIKLNSSDMKIKGISEATKISILTDSEKK
jgi:hypothetical protein